MDDQDNKTGSGAQSPAPVSGRPLTAEDVALLRRGDVLRRRSDGTLCAVTTANPEAFRTERGLNSRGMAQNFTFIGRPDSEGWIAWSGGENPVPGQRVECRFRDDAGSGLIRSQDMFPDWWRHVQTVAYGHDRDIIAFRLSRPASDVAGGVEREAVEVVEDAIYRHVGVDHRGDLYGTKGAAEDILAALSPASPARTPMGENPEDAELMSMLDDYADRYIGATRGEDMSLEEVLISKARERFAALAASPQPEAGEARPTYRITWEDDATNPNDRRMYVDGQQWAKVYGWNKASLDARCSILTTAMATPPSVQPVEGK